MIPSLLLSILIEGAILVAYARWKKRPAGRWVLALTIANLLTQTMLWMALHLNPGHYLATLFAAEALIWLLEGAVLYVFPGTGLRLPEALALSLVMNLASFGIGWFLPV